MLFANIHKLVTSGNRDAVAKFLDKHPETVNDSPKGQSRPLEMALASDDKEMAKLLLTRAASAADKSGQGSILRAALLSCRDIEIVKLLFASGARPDSHDDEGYALAEAFADLSDEKEDGERAYKKACAKEFAFCRSLFDLCFEKGLVIDAELNGQVMAEAAEKSPGEVIDYLLGKGFRLVYDCEYGYGSPLIDAIKGHNDGAYRRLIEAGPDLNAIGPGGYTALHAAIDWYYECAEGSILADPQGRKVSEAIIRDLLGRGANIDIRDNGNMSAFASICYLQFFRTGKAEGPLVELLRPLSKDPIADNLYNQICSASRDSKVPIRCKYCGKDFTLTDLIGYRRARRGEDKSYDDIKCPHCNGAQGAGIILADL